MARKRKTYSREFKIEAVLLAETSGKLIAAIKRDLGLSVGQIHHWRRQLADEGKEAFPGKSHLRACLKSPRRAQQPVQRFRVILAMRRTLINKDVFRSKATCQTLAV